MRLERLLLAVLICRHATVAMAAAKTTLVIAPSTQSGGFLHGHDVGPMNPHSYRPNEFFANDFIFEGLVAPDPDSSGGVASSPESAAGSDDVNYRFVRFVGCLLYLDLFSFLPVLVEARCEG